MNAAFRLRFWRCAVALAFLAAAVPLAVSSQGTPTSDDVAIELPTVTSIPELPSPTPEPPTAAPTNTPEAPTPLPPEIVPPETQSPTPEAAPTETPSTTVTATATTTATPIELSIRVESADLSFGRIDASGTLGNSAPAGIVSEPLEDGAYFVVPAAVVVEVEGRDPWHVSCAATGTNDVSLDMIQAGRLEWRVAGEGEWNAFAAPPGNPICLQEPGGGSRQFVLDVRLYLASADPPGPLAVTLVFSVAGQG